MTSTLPADTAVASATEKPGHAVLRRRPPSITTALEHAGLPLFLGLLILFFALNEASSTAFRSSANVNNIFANQSVTGLIALAMVVPLVCGYFDLSVAAIAGLTNVTAAAVIGTHGQPIYIGILAAFAVGTAAGLINALLVAGLRLNGFIATLGTYTLIGGLLQWYTKGQTITNGIPRELSDWGTQALLGIPVPFWLLMAVSIVTWYLLMQTPFGRRLEAIGSNESAARLVGIRVDRAVALTFVISALLATVAGVLLTIRSGGANPTSGTAYLFPALAAVFLGATAIRPGRYNVWGTIFGVFLVAVAVNGFTFMGAQAWVTPVFNGSALVLAVAVSTLMGRARDNTARRKLRDRSTRRTGAAGEPGPGGGGSTATTDDAARTTISG
ncbi:ABC transporter permease [Nocardioides carbamazepini]|uniref:ABC transporter permease n=1 Tax=Nocardioides carbamazepini TaxID=2854259 RepID=UPI00214A850E|nr:ABC transporter permease [Nocardioides carbamazepini]MCR1783667.1 ABC transporter permease [Nocardioides carbamazepini]